MNVIDLVIIGLLLLGAINGYRKGFVGSLVGVFSSIIGLIVAYKYYAVFEKWLDGKLGLEKTLSKFIGSHITLPQTVSQFKLGDNLFNDVSNYLDSLQLSEQIKGQLLTYLERLEESVGSSLQLPLSEIIHQYLAVIILSVAAFCIIWCSVNILLEILTAIFRSLINTTPLGQVDRLGGIAAGALLNAVSLMVIIGLFTPLISMAGIAEFSLLSPVISAYEGSEFAPYFLSAFTFFFSKFIL